MTAVTQTNKEPGVDPEWVEISSGGGGSSFVRTVTTLPAVSGNGTFDVGVDAFRVISIEADGPCRLRLYRDAADRTADESRPHTEAPAVQGIVLAEFRWESAHTYWATGFVSFLYDGTSTVYYRVDDGPATVDIKWIGAN